MEPLTAAGVAGALHIAAQVKASMKAGHDTVKEGASYFRKGSLIEIAQVARVEPILIVDADCMNISYLSAICQAMHGIFSGYYMQAMNLLGNVGGVSVASKLAPLNPNRSLGFEDRKDWRYASESYTHRLPTTHNKRAAALESMAVESRMDVGDKDIANLKDAANLSIGKMFNVKITEGDQSASIPVAIRLMASVIPTRSVVNLMTFKSGMDTEFKERYHGWKSGRLSFIKDLVLCRDLIKKHRDTLIDDDTGLYANILGRANANFASGLINKNPSMATASNLAIISMNTAGMIEEEMGGKLDDFKTRQQIFDNTNLMIMAVVEPDWQMVTFYHAGVKEATKVSEKDLKVSERSGGGDTLDIMKAYMAGTSPSI